MKMKKFVLLLCAPYPAWKSEMASPLKYENCLSSIYYDPKHAGAYGGVEPLYRDVTKKVNLCLVELKFVTGY